MGAGVPRRSVMTALALSCLLASCSSSSAPAGAGKGSTATITGQILFAGPAQLRPLAGTVWAHDQDIHGEVVASADTDSRDAFTLSVPAPGMYVIAGDSPQFNGGSPIPTSPVAACVSSPVSVSPETTATVQVLCQGQ